MFKVYKNDVRFVFTFSCLYKNACLNYVIYLFAFSGVQHILRCVFVLFFFLLCTYGTYAKFSGLSIIGCPFGILYVYLFSWDMSCTVIFPKYVKMCTINALLLYTYSMETYEVQNKLEVALQPVK